MAEQNLTDYFVFIRAVFELATKVWQNGEGKFEVSVSDDKGKTEASIKGGPTWRSKKATGEEDP